MKGLEEGSCEPTPGRAMVVNLTLKAARPLGPAHSQTPHGLAQSTVGMHWLSLRSRLWVSPKGVLPGQVPAWSHMPVRCGLLSLATALLPHAAILLWNLGPSAEQVR